MNEISQNAERRNPEDSFLEVGLPERHNTELTRSMMKLVSDTGLQKAMKALSAGSADTFAAGITSADPEVRKAYLCAAMLREDDSDETLSIISRSTALEENAGVRVVGGVVLIHLLKSYSGSSNGDPQIIDTVAYASVCHDESISRIGLKMYLYRKGQDVKESAEAFLAGIYDPACEETEKKVCLQALVEWKGDSAFLVEKIKSRLETVAVPSMADLKLFATFCEDTLLSEEVVDKILALVSSGDDEQLRYAALKALTAGSGNEQKVSDLTYKLLNTEKQEPGLLLLAGDLAGLHASKIKDPEAFIAPFVDRLMEQPDFFHDLCAAPLNALAVQSYLKGRPVRNDLIEVMPSLYRLARSESDEMQVAVLRIFGFLGHESDDALPEIGRLLKSENEEVRRVASVAAFRLGESGAALRPSFVEGITAKDELTRALSALALARVDFNLEDDLERVSGVIYEEKHHQTVKILKEQFSVSIIPSVKQGMLITLGRVVDEFETVKLEVLESLTSKHEDVCDGALFVIGLHETKDSDVLSALKSLGEADRGKLSERASLMHKYLLAEEEE